MTRLMCLLCFCIPFTLSYANSSLTQTQAKLQQMEADMSRLQNRLLKARNNYSALNQELAHTEKKIGVGVRQLNEIERSMLLKQRQTAQLKTQESQLNQQVQTQINLMSDHLRARYKMKDGETWQWLLHQDDPHTVSRLATYYQYLIQSRHQVIQTLQKTQHDLKQTQQELQRALVDEERLQQQVKTRQIKLAAHKQYQMQLIHALSQSIQNNQHALSEIERNKENLSRLLQSFNQQRENESHTPFVWMRRKLPWPVNNGQNHAERSNQGLEIFSNEGVPVTAVYSGKVVFSDWLKGYGLLLIIDHGRQYMTLYAHNQSLYKQKGEFVRQGEQIATLGHSGGNKQNSLYFEVRHRGKTLPPLDWLSR